MELDEAIRERVLRGNVLIDIIRIDRTLPLALIHDFLQLFVLLLERLNVTVYHG